MCWLNLPARDNERGCRLQPGTKCPEADFLHPSFCHFSYLFSAIFLFTFPS